MVYYSAFLLLYILTIFTEPVTEDWSLQANLSSVDLKIEDGDGSFISQALLAKKLAQIPDFVGLLYAQSIINRKTPLIVEIKPYRYSSPYAIIGAIRRMVPQTLLQARFAFEAYFENQTIHILCVVGMYWAMYSVNRKDLDLLPKKGQLETGQSNEARRFLQSIRTRLVARHLLDDTTSSYSGEFQRAWDGFAASNGLQAAFAHT